MTWLDDQREADSQPLLITVPVPVAVLVEAGIGTDEGDGTVRFAPPPLRQRPLVMRLGLEVIGTYVVEAVEARFSEGKPMCLATLRLVER